MYAFNKHKIINSSIVFRSENQRAVSICHPFIRSVFLPGCSSPKKQMRAQKSELNAFQCIVRCAVHNTKENASKQIIITDEQRF